MASEVDRAPGDEDGTQYAHVDRQLAAKSYRALHSRARTWPLTMRPANRWDWFMAALGTAILVAILIVNLI
ncbi:MAG: hypothetical protein HYR63_27940 [Proteobacteria bacterium]|nr:hypothetical protein [Pseudomonadota bacterium]MBI3497921.1 hypothetical protein [Pseudomonadota bacterium]